MTAVPCEAKLKERACEPLTLLCMLTSDANLLRLTIIYKTYMSLMRVCQTIPHHMPICQKTTHCAVHRCYNLPFRSSCKLIETIYLDINQSSICDIYVCPRCTSIRLIRSVNQPPIRFSAFEKSSSCTKRYKSLDRRSLDVLLVRNMYLCESTRTSLFFHYFSTRVFELRRVCRFFFRPVRKTSNQPHSTVQ